MTEPEKTHDPLFSAWLKAFPQDVHNRKKIEKN